MDGLTYMDELPKFRKDAVDFEMGAVKLYLDKDATEARQDLKENVTGRWWDGAPHYHWTIPLASVDEFVAWLERHGDGFTMTKRAKVAIEGALE